MKITKRKWAGQPPLFFYRNTTAGKLTEQDDHKQDYTTCLFERPTTADVFETSLKSRLLKSYDKSDKNLVDNDIAVLISCLCKGCELGAALGKIKQLTPEDAEKRCRESLSGYGRSYTAEGKTTTLYKALMQLMTGSVQERTAARGELEEIKRSLQGDKKNSIARVRTSIQNNRVPFRIEGDIIEPDSARAEWLMGLMNAGGAPSCYPIIDEMEKAFDYYALAVTLQAKLTECAEKPVMAAKAVDEAVRAHCQGQWEKHPTRQTDMRYYFQAVHGYFKESFPIRKKPKGRAADPSRLIEAQHMKNAVRRRLINQSTQMHILCGKLYEYCTGDDALPINSDTLQTVQVLEAVKKQTMTALLWSIARLQDLYQFYKGDILANKDGCEAKEHRAGFLDTVSNSETDFQACKDKLESFFPLTDDADRAGCKKLLQACVSCIREIRIGIFHFKRRDFMEALSQAAAKVEQKDSGTLNTIKKYYIADLQNLQDAFIERISSMNLPLYYPADLLNKMLAGDGTSFSLYSADVQMTPSFKRVYERGKNLRGECPLKWFAQLDDMRQVADPDAQRALRNLLKFIYEYGFLPAVLSDETLVTRHIKDVLTRNRQLAEKSKTPKAAGYSEIEAFYLEDMSLSKLMREMQRKISRTEQENRELAQDKTDYAKRFLREVYAVAFNTFLEQHYTACYTAVMNPKKDLLAASTWAEAAKLPKLHTALTETAGNWLLVLYPVLRLLDGPELSEFQQQMRRYRTSMGTWPGKTPQAHELEAVKAIEELIELVKLAEQVTTAGKKEWQERAWAAFTPYIEGSRAQYGQFYFQSDSVTPVFYRNMNKLLRSGVLDACKKVFAGQKLATKADYQIIQSCTWVMQNVDGQWITFVEHAQSELQRLHREYEKSHTLSPGDFEAYRKMLNYLDRYNHARRNLTFETLYGVSRILLEMMSRWVGFAQDWERDMYFLLLAWVKQGKLSLTEAQVSAIFDGGYVVSNIKNTLKGSDLDAYLSIYRSGADKGLNFAKVRNSIAHLDLLRGAKWKGAQGGSVVDNTLDRLRILLSYDQKRMNAVTKTLLECLDDHGVSARYEMAAGGKLQLVEGSVKAKPIKHLQGIRPKAKADEIVVPFRGAAYIRSLEHLLKYPKTGINLTEGSHPAKMKP